jgi:hypothetical protein
MNRNSTGLVGLLAPFGMMCGLAFSILVLTGSAATQAPGKPVQEGSRPIMAGGSAGAPPGNEKVKVGLPTASRAAAAPTALASFAFTYQGKLQLGGQPVNESCDLQFARWNALAGGTQLGTTQTIPGAVVANGLFTVLLNAAGQFDNPTFDGRASWIETGVRCPGGGGSYTLLTPRQALTAVPLAAALVPHTTIAADDAFSGFANLSIKAPVGAWSNPMGLEVHGGGPSNYIGTFSSTGVWGDSASGKGVWGTTSNGYGILGSAGSEGWAGYFEGNVTVTGKLNVPRFHTTQVINGLGPMPITSASFTTSGGTLILFYSGSGYSNVSGALIGMAVTLDGSPVDQTGVYANQSLFHLAFVAKQWVVTGIAAGPHTITISAMNAHTLTDGNDIFQVVVTEMPY